MSFYEWVLLGGFLYLCFAILVAKCIDFGTSGDENDYE